MEILHKPEELRASITLVASVIISGPTPSPGKSNKLVLLMTFLEYPWFISFHFIFILIDFIRMF